MAKRAQRGEQSRSESITTRLHPQLKFGLELLARQQHRSASAVLETLLEKALAEQEGLDLDWLWHPCEGIRALRMQKSPIASQLLSYEERVALEYLPLFFSEHDHQELLKISDYGTRTPRQVMLISFLDAIWPSFKSLVSKPGGMTEEDSEKLHDLCVLQWAYSEGRIDYNRLEDLVRKQATTKE